MILCFYAILEKPKIADRYCFEMLTLVLALADHKLGRSYLSQQSNLIQNLMQLLHVGTPRIQRQVCFFILEIIYFMTVLFAGLYSFNF